MTTFRACSLALSLFALGVILGILCSGCAALGMKGEPQRREGQEVAAWIIHHDVYGRRDRPPVIRWHEGAALNCTDEASGRPGMSFIGLPCREGRTFTPFDVHVAWHDGDFFSTTALAHEMMHVVLLRDARGKLPGDPGHDEPEFTRLNECGDCQFAPPEPMRTCRTEDLLGFDCTTIQMNPCGKCGQVDWANEQLQRRGL